MSCLHAADQRACRERCARCGHLCPVHRGGASEHGCWECECPAWLDATGIALLDEEVEVHIDDRHAVERRFRVLVVSWGKQAGEIRLAPGAAAAEVMVEHVRLKPAFRGRRIAAEVYAELARALAELEPPLVLTSMPAGRLTAAEKRIWDGQLARGHAQRTVAGHYHLMAPPARPPTWRGSVAAERERQKSRGAPGEES